MPQEKSKPWNQKRTKRLQSLCLQRVEDWNPPFQLSNSDRQALYWWFRNRAVDDYGGWEIEGVKPGELYFTSGLPDRQMLFPTEFMNAEWDCDFANPERDWSFTESIADILNGESKELNTWQIAEHGLGSENLSAFEYVTRCRSAGYLIPFEWIDPLDSLAIRASSKLELHMYSYTAHFFEERHSVPIGMYEPFLLDLLTPGEFKRTTPLQLPEIERVIKRAARELSL